MGRSKASCLKIIACGSDSADTEDTHQPPSEYKGSSDKRGWSFRKRSARHRVLSNTVETPSSNKEIPEIITNSLETQPKETFIEKNTAITWIDDTPESDNVISKVSDAPQSDFVISKAFDDTVASENEKSSAKDDNIKSTVDETVIVVIQAAVRGFLAKRQMLRVKNVVKVQAAVRGHLVRSHAVGTLRCVQAIVKMQGLVRARQARISSEKKPLDKESLVTKPRVEYVSIEKLLTNKFAHQLLESTPRTKHINIKCDPSSRSDSAWSWLERWMLISSKEPVKSPVDSPSEICESTDAEDDNVKIAVDHEKPSIPNFNSISQIEKLDTSVTKEISLEPNSDEKKKQYSVSEMERPKEVYTEPQMEIDQPKAVSSERESSSSEARKAAFIAVQSKFEESSTAPTLARSTSSRKSKSEAISFSAIESEITRREAKVDIGSECGTELSVTSALDSPDRSDTGLVDSEKATELMKEGSVKCEDLDDEEAKAEPDMDISKDDIDMCISNPTSVQVDKVGNVSGAAEVEESAVKVTTVALELEKQNMDTKESDEKLNLIVEPDHQAPATSSALGSPRTQTIVSEFQTTPSSEVSVKTKRSKSDKKRSSNQKTKSSPSNQNQNSGLKNSIDGIPKDLKSKRRNSFGKSDYADQEPRDSSSSSSLLPSYMQATESAKLKALNSSPRSSPDMLDREVHLKKRHSLPGANGKQDSPRLQHSKSQVNPGAKPIGHSQERKWQR